MIRFKAIYSRVMSPVIYTPWSPRVENTDTLTHTHTHTHTHAYHRHRCFALYAGRRPLTLNSRLVVDKVLPRTFTVSLFVVGAAALLIASELN